MKRLLMLIACAACQSRTELMIGVVTDLRAPSAVDNVQLLVTRVDNGGVEQQVSWSVTGLVGQPFNLPGSYGVYSDGDEVALDLKVTGLKGVREVVTRHAILNLIEGRTLFFRMGLTAGCIDRSDCAPSQDCVDGTCQDLHINAAQLPEFVPELVGQVTCLGNAQYIDTSTGAAMPSSDDAAMCPVGLCVEGTCLHPAPKDDKPRTVTGTSFTTFIDTNRTTTRANDVSELMPRVLIPDDRGGYTALQGTGTREGSFAIAGVPGGTYLLQVGNQALVTSLSSFDLSIDLIGRPDKVPVAATTSITLNLTNLDPWIDGDVLEAYSAGADTWWFNLEGANREVKIPQGTKALTGFTFDNTTAVDSSPTGFGANLIRGDLGDRFAVVQLTQKTTAGGVFYFAASKFFAPPPFTQTDGGTVTLDGAFTDVALSNKITIDARETEFEAAVGFDKTTLAATLLNPEAKPFAQSPPFFGRDGLEVTILGEVGGTAFGQIGATADFLSLNLGFGADVVASEMTFGTPVVLGEKWGHVLGYQWLAQVSFLPPGMTTPVMVAVGLAGFRVLGAGNGPIVPVLGPVLTPTIAGKDLFHSQTAFGPTPTIAWQAPAHGVPTAYHVTIIRLSATTAGMMRDVSGSITTTATSVVVPPGIFIPGEWYAIRISADTAPNPNAPGRHVFPEAFSSIVSGLMTPGVPVDGGVPIDAGVPVDGGVQVDGGAPVDGGVPVDGGGKAGLGIIDSIPVTNANVESVTTGASYSRSNRSRLMRKL